MMLISIMLLKFESTVKMDHIWWRHHSEENENMEYQYLGNEIKYEGEIS